GGRAWRFGPTATGRIAVRTRVIVAGGTSSMPCAAASPTSIPMMPSSAQPCKGVGDHPRSLCRRRRTCANCDFLKEVWTMSAESLSLDQNGERRITPQKFSHTVIRTTRLKEMVEWYQTVLN